MSEESGPIPASYPTLATLGLGREQLAALAKQGTLRAEGHSGSRRYFKLRFRMGPTQRVRYVGNNPEFVDLVRAELLRLQAQAKARRHLQRLIREANQCLRRTKHRLEPLLPLAARRFHGREIRRRREDAGACLDGNETL